ncbi:tetratricopeptide repeat protein [Amycolatopsis sp. WAC 04197]|uniref:tetratricopeptide repeat protein n=1 Tax=Amycolatopsis sp. WAC 04197 TaxID=2203199 RepID=UPI000F7AFFF3|nr:tetratricopeptide repeat protein [Amycolatopsis sp. WAC 04197]
MEWERVAAVTGPDDRPGSGYVITPRLVLTSAHVVAEVDSSASVFRPGREGTFAAKVVWRGTAGGRDDAALLEVLDPDWPALEPGRVSWGRTVTHHPGISCECWGVPNLVQGQGLPVEVEQLTGTLNPGDRIVGDRYVMRLQGHPPEGASPWGGLSGAALFCGGLLTGVVATDPRGRAHTVLEAVPASILLRDATFAKIVTTHDDVAFVACHGIELRSLTDSPARSLNGGLVTSPAGLLPARRAIVPFHGREEILTGLKAWASEPGTGIWLLHGPGGQGKTRLAHQLGEDLARDGWSTVWLASGIATQQLQVLTAVRTPTLVVIDYAEARASQLASLADVLTQGVTPAPVKVLLLARTAGAWWDHLPAERDALRDLVEAAYVAELPVLDDTDDARRDSYRSALTAFSAAIPQIPRFDSAEWKTAAVILATQPTPNIHGHTVLAVQMTALADLLDATTPARKPADGARGPEDRLLDHERGYWRRTAGTHDLVSNASSGMLDDAVAAATLLAPRNVEELDEALAHIPSVADLDRDRRDSLRVWLLHLYPMTSDGGFEGLAPDRLAERHIGRLLMDVTRPCVLDSLAAAADEEQMRRILTYAVRAAAHAVFGTQVGGAVTTLCVKHPVMQLAAVDIAHQVEDPAPLFRALDEVVANPDTDRVFLWLLSARFPTQSLVLGDLAITVLRALVERHRSIRLGSDFYLDLDGLAVALNDLSIRLAHLGRQEESLDSIVQAVAIRRVLADLRPEAHLHTLAGSLTNLSTQLGRVGRFADALSAAEESIGHFHHLVERQPDKQFPELAMALTVYSASLHDLGRLEEALAVAREAVEFHRRAAGDHSEPYLTHLAFSLHSFAQQLGAMHYIEEALDLAREAVEIRRHQAEEQPDMYLPGLAESLNGLSTRLAEMGHLDEALTIATEAVDLYRQLVLKQPDSHLRGLSASLHNRSGRLGDLGHGTEGLLDANEAVEIIRRLAEGQPEAHLSDLATSLHNQSARLNDLGYSEEALESISEAADLCRRSTLEQSGPRLRHLAIVLSSMGTQLHHAGRAVEGLAVITEGVEIYRELAREHPDNDAPGLAVCLHNLSIVLGACGQAEKALSAITEAVDLRRQLAKQLPEAYLSDLASSLNSFSVRLRELDCYEEALDASMESVDILRQLTKQHPDAHLPDLASSLSNLGTRFGELGCLDEALDLTVEAVALWRQLAERQPRMYLRNLATGLNNLSVSLAASGRREEGSTAITEAIEIWRGLVDHQPATYERDLQHSLRVLNEQQPQAD